jgi:hypothetical protein
MTDTWYYVRDGQQVGPVSRRQLITELLRSPFWQHEPVWRPGDPTWLEAGSIGELSTELTLLHLGREVLPNQPRSRATPVWVKVLIYAGLAVLGIVLALIYRWLF